MIRVKKLSFSYLKGMKVLDDIDLNIGTGECLAFIGPSGVGKSTLLKCLNGLLKPASGSIQINQKEIIGISEKEIQKVRVQLGMVFQDFNLIQRISAIDNVLTGRLPHIPFYRKYIYGFTFSEQDFQISLDSLKRVQMEKFAFRRVDNLSGGQQQRIGVARVLAQEPKIILADEPVSNLDPKIKIEIMELLISICKLKSLTLLISMHEVELVKRFVLRVVGLRDGQIIFDNIPNKLTKDKYVQIYH
ncbi:Phosphate-import ATP-binding protein PhnC [subsurface metagenome]